MSGVYILTYECFPKTGGVATFIHEVAAAAGRQGLDVVVIAPAGSRAPEPSPYRIETFSRRWWRLGMTLALLRRWRELRHVILYLPQQRALRAFMFLQLVPLLRPAELILTLHGTEIFYFEALPHRRRLFAALLRRAMRVTVLSQYCGRLLAERFPEAGGSICVAPGAVRSRLLGQNRPRDGSSGTKLVLLTVARLHPRKGQLDVLQALDRLAPELKAGIIFRMVGAPVDRAYQRALEAFASERQLHVEMLGEVADDRLPECYSQADIFIMPSSERESRSEGVLARMSQERSVEGFGLSYLEAAAFGLPVLAYRSGGVAEAVRDGETGILVPENDIAALSDALTRLIRDTSLRTRLGEGGRQWAQQFSWDDTARLVFASKLAPTRP